MPALVIRYGRICSLESACKLSQSNQLMWARSGKWFMCKQTIQAQAEYILCLDYLYYPNDVGLSLGLCMKTLYLPKTRAGPLMLCAVCSPRVLAFSGSTFSESYGTSTSTAAGRCSGCWFFTAPTCASSAVTPELVFFHGWPPGQLMPAIVRHRERRDILPAAHSKIHSWALDSCPRIYSFFFNN